MLLSAAAFMALQVALCIAKIRQLLTVKPIIAADNLGKIDR